MRYVIYLDLANTWLSLFVLFIIQEGTVLSYDPISGAVSVELTKESLKKTQGKFGVVQKVND